MTVSLGSVLDKTKRNTPRPWGCSCRRGCTEGGIIPARGDCDKGAEWKNLRGVADGKSSARTGPRRHPVSDQLPHLVRKHREGDLLAVGLPPDQRLGEVGRLLQRYLGRHGRLEG